MNESEREFDRFSDEYEQLLKDPIRDRFSPGGAEFFHARKADLIRKYFYDAGADTRKLAYLDVGCGRGELVSLLRSDFSRVAGCDVSPGMIEAGNLAAKGIDTRVQDDPARIPFNDGEFDFITAVCVYHHVPPPARTALTREIARLLRPGGVLSIVEHNPFNPATRLIVSRTPVDADAILLRASETRSLLRQAALKIDRQTYFLYFPQSWYRNLGWLEGLLGKFPMGGQYAVFARRDGR
jgi:SAM-dependent methyltransferase